MERFVYQTRRCPSLVRNGHQAAERRRIKSVGLAPARAAKSLSRCVWSNHPNSCAISVQEEAGFVQLGVDGGVQPDDAAVEFWRNADLSLEDATKLTRGKAALPLKITQRRLAMRHAHDGARRPQAGWMLKGAASD